MSSQSDNNGSLLMTIPIGSIRDGSNHTEASTVSLPLAGEDWLMASEACMISDEASLFSDIAQEDVDEFASFEPLEESPSSEEFSVADVYQTTSTTSEEQQHQEEEDEDDALMSLLLQEVAQEPESLFPRNSVIGNDAVAYTPSPPPTFSCAPSPPMIMSSRCLSPGSIIQWGEHDVPLGRCQEVREHVGNIRYRELVEQHRHAYQKTTRKSDKTVISTMIYNIIRTNGGRFLDRKKVSKQDKMMVATNEWFEIPQDKAIAKIAQSLRNGIRPVKKEKSLLQQQQQQQQQKRKSTKITTPINTAQPPRRVSIQEKEDRYHPYHSHYSKPTHYAGGYHHYPAPSSWHHHSQPVAR